MSNAFKYDPLPLNARVDRTEDAEEWRRETVTIDAAYGGERVIVYLYLPKSGSPPYQTVIYFPGGDAQLIPSSRSLRLVGVDFLIRSGRAVVFPVYKGTYERIPCPGAPGPNRFRDMTIARVKDFRRTVEYLETRSDLDHERLGYFGRSLGANAGTIITAIEPRLKASVCTAVGSPVSTRPKSIRSTSRRGSRAHPDGQRRAICVPARKHAEAAVPSARPPPIASASHFEGGHMPIDFNGVLREILDWLIAPRTQPPERAVGRRHVELLGKDLSGKISPLSPTFSVYVPLFWRVSPCITHLDAVPSRDYDAAGMPMHMRKVLAAALVLSGATLCATDYLTEGVDNGRTGWMKDEKTFTTANVKDMKLLWKVKLAESTPREMHNLFSPLIAERVTTAQGTIEMGLVAGISDDLWGLDVATGKVLWHRRFDSTYNPPPGGRGGGTLCPGGQTAVPVIAPTSTAGKSPCTVSDGRLRQLNLADGVDLAPAEKFMPANGKPHALNLWNGTIYTATAQGAVA